MNPRPVRRGSKGYGVDGQVKDLSVRGVRRGESGTIRIRIIGKPEGRTVHRALQKLQSRGEASYGGPLGARREGSRLTAGQRKTAASKERGSICDNNGRHRATRTREVRMGSVSGDQGIRSVKYQTRTGGACGDGVKSHHWRARSIPGYERQTTCESRTVRM